MGALSESEGNREIRHWTPQHRSESLAEIRPHVDSGRDKSSEPEHFDKSCSSTMTWTRFVLLREERDVI